MKTDLVRPREKPHLNAPIIVTGKNFEVITTGVENVLVFYEKRNFSRVPPGTGL